MAVCEKQYQVFAIAQRYTESIVVQYEDVAGG